MHLSDLLNELARSVQDAQEHLAEYGLHHFLAGYDDDGNPDTGPFLIGAAKRALPQSTFRHHRPLTQKRVVFEMEAQFDLVDSVEGVYRLDVKPRRGDGDKRMMIRVEYGSPEADPTPEGVSLLHERLLAAHHQKDVSDDQPD